MQIGSLGGVVFEVDPKKIKTPRDIKWSGSARIQNHSRHLGNALTEFTGNDPDSFEMTIRLSAYLGVDPYVEVRKLWDYMREGRTLPLTIGRVNYGKYRWTINKLSIKMEHYDKVGKVTTMDVSISLTEYLRG